jgi:hypothetical protein
MVDIPKHYGQPEKISESKIAKIAASGSSYADRIHKSRL